MNKRHHQYGPSMLDNLSNCIRFKYIPFKDDDAASEGTLLHEAYETENLIGLDDEQTMMVQAIIDYTNSILATKGGPEMWEEIREGKVELIDLTYGTADRFLIHKTEPILYVIDAKFTRRHAEHNMQLRTYAAAMLEMQYNKNGREFETVFTVTAAPRLGPPDVNEYHAPLLLTTVREEIEALYERIENPFNPPTPHEDLCEKCAWASECSALNQVVAHVAPKIGLPMPKIFDLSVTDISDRDRRIRQVLAGALQNWAEQAKKDNADYVKDSGNKDLLDGFKLVTRSTGFRVNSELTPLAISALLAAGITTNDEILENCTIKIGALTKQIAKKEEKPEAEIKETIKELLTDIGSEGFATFLTKTKRVSDEQMLLDTK